MFSLIAHQVRSVHKNWQECPSLFYVFHDKTSWDAGTDWQEHPLSLFFIHVYHSTPLCECYGGMEIATQVES